MAEIDVFFSTLSPFTYLAGLRVQDIAARHGARVTYKPLDIMALFDRTGGIRPADRHPSRLAYRLQELRRWSAKLAMPLNLKPMYWPTNPAPSSYAIIAAQAAGADVGPLAHAFGRAVWAEERNIGDEDVVRAVMAAQGFDPAIADRGMLAAAETYGRNLDEAVERGVFGAPFYAVGAELFWGQDRLDDLDAHLAGL
ncbi:MAG: 2-hydroxychromene-2-carboxylate isomerase [Gemmobacter sp.]